ncbi:hypothetical protein [Puia dinghuensis]|uniref:Uncharacterized protein n=1 Tax=Puia dinghuensis TaxID=1792502 RepID=A0A8J2XS77_9BACT|nr:hypothetical protein [Puia dinghuensis]GGA93107.1 hypothetical protein GCM10011511_15650 [Puia dinghuensis]
MTIRLAGVQDIPAIQKVIQLLGYESVDKRINDKMQRIFADPEKYSVAVIEKENKITAFAQITFLTELPFGKTARINYYSPENILQNVPGIGPVLEAYFLQACENCEIVDLFFEKPEIDDQNYTLKNTYNTERSFRIIPLKDDGPLAEDAPPLS